MSGCTRCGMCCARPSLVVESWQFDDYHRGLAQFWQMHHIEIKVVPGIKGVVIQFPLTCENLDFDDDAGVAICRIYDNRPDICKNYLCTAAQKRNGE